MNARPILVYTYTSLEKEREREREPNLKEGAHKGLFRKVDEWEPCGIYIENSSTIVYALDQFEIKINKNIVPIIKWTHEPIHIEGD